MWFEQLMGFAETNHVQVQGNIEIRDGGMISKINGKSYRFGQLEFISLETLRERCQKKSIQEGTIRLSEKIGNIQHFHINPENRNALFQAASQFNLLEMVGPSHTPEEGVGIYEYDRTQGPACAIACGAGTIYRNYFVPVDGGLGQTATHQLNGLSDIGSALGNEQEGLWKMRNGYALASSEGLDIIHSKIESLSEKEYEYLKGKLKIGIQWDTEVTLNEAGHCVSQIYCSALPVAYSNIDRNKWAAFAQLILEATYEATICAALLNPYIEHKKVFLTLVGGGVFGNSQAWISDAIKHSLSKYENYELEVIFVSYGSSSSLVQEVIADYK